mgnify:CR=1 FL=1
MSLDLIANRKYNLIVDIQNLIEMYDLSYIDAILLYCERNDIEIEQFAEIVKTIPKIYSELEIEAEKLNIIKKTTRLQFE